MDNLRRFRSRAIHCYTSCVHFAILRGRIFHRCIWNFTGSLVDRHDGSRRQHRRRCFNQIGADIAGLAVYFYFIPDIAVRAGFFGEDGELRARGFQLRNHCATGGCGVAHVYVIGIGRALHGLFGLFGFIASGLLRLGELHQIGTDIADIFAVSGLIPDFAIFAFDLRQQHDFRTFSFQHGYDVAAHGCAAAQVHAVARRPRGCGFHFGFSSFHRFQPRALHQHRQIAIAEDILRIQRIFLTGYRAAGIAFDGVYGSIGYALHDANMIGFAIALIGLAVLPTEEDQIARLRNIIIALFIRAQTA